MRLSSLKSWSASADSVSPLTAACDSYTGVTLWHRAMAFTASWMRLLTLLRTLGPDDWLFRDGVVPPVPLLLPAGWEVT